MFVNLKFQHLSLGSLENKISVGCYVVMSRAEKTGCDIIGSAYSRIYVFDCPHDAVFNAYFKKIHSGTRFQKDCIIINRIHWVRVDGRPIKIKSICIRVNGVYAIGS